MVGSIDLALIKEQSSVSHKSLPQSPVKGINLMKVESGHKDDFCEKPVYRAIN